MNPEYTKFHQLKNMLKEQEKEKYSERTLKYWTMIGEMLDSPDWARSSDYLESVYEYIENNEIITEAQMKVVDRIYNHPDGEGYNGTADDYNSYSEAPPF